MNFKTKIVILSLILIGTCLIQIALHKKTYEGFVSVSNAESSLSFSQIDRKYNNSKDCKFKDFEVGQYVEINLKDPSDYPTSEFLENKDEYITKWKSAVITAVLDNNQYNVKYDGSDDEDTVNENKIKSHHQNNCELCGNRDDKCSADCMDPVKIGGDCMPVRTGKDGSGNDIFYQVCPSICRNDSKQPNDLICQGDNCCKGCGYAVFQVADNTGVISGQPNPAQPDEATILHKLKKIPYPWDYQVDHSYNYDEVMQKEEKRIQDAMTAASSATTSTSEPASSSTAVATANSNESSTSSSAPATEDSVTASGEAVNSETSNIVNAFNDSNDCWVGPTGHDGFMYCGPAPFSF